MFRNKAFLMTMLLMGGAMNGPVRRSDDEEFGYEEREKKAPLPRGCQEYTIDGITVVSYSEKAARKKVAKIKARKAA